MIILGVDPGFKCAGYSVIQRDGRRALVLDYGYLRMNPTKPLPERVAIFFDFFQEKIMTYKITDLAIETPFLGKNAQNFMKLGYLRGILYLLSHKHGAQLHEFTPGQVKQSITGYGGASKEQVARALQMLFPGRRSRRAGRGLRHGVPPDGVGR